MAKTQCPKCGKDSQYGGVVVWCECSGWLDQQEQQQHQQEEVAMTDVEKAEKKVEEASAALTEARVKMAEAAREKPLYGSVAYDEYRAEVMKPLIDARNRAEGALWQAQRELKEEKRKAAVAGTFKVTTDEYGARTMTKLETGETVTTGQRVTVGKSKTVWDVAVNMYSGSGKVELHRQNPWTPGMRHNTVIYRHFHFNQLHVVKEN